MNLPNKLTIIRIISVPIFIYFYAYTEHTNIAFIVFVLASATDALDGIIARKYGLITNFGKIMDPLADKILVYAAMCVMVEKGIVPGWVLAVILAREFLTAGIRTVAAGEGKIIAAAFSGKVKTVLQMIAVPLLILNSPDLIAKAGRVFLWASLAATVWSGAEYTWKNREVFKG